jgi:hypothetical protein
MIDDHQNTSIVPHHTAYFRRVLRNDATRKGAAAALAGIVIGLLTEALWPSVES